MKPLLIGLILGSLLTTGTAWAIHKIGHTTIFPEGSPLDRFEREADHEQAQKYDQQRNQRFLNPC